MTGAMIAALFFTVALLATTAYFIMGSIPLLVLGDGTPLNARFVRGFFNIYYVMAIVTASATSISYALAGHVAIAAGAAALALLAAALRRKVTRRRQCARSPDPLSSAWRRFQASAEPTSSSSRDPHCPTRGDRLGASSRYHP